MKILIADKFPQFYIDKLKELNHTVDYSPKLKESDLETAAADAEIIIVRSTAVNETAINNAQRLKLVIRAGSGYNNISVKAATAKKIYVSNCPGKNAIAVAELTIGFILSLDRRIPDNVIDFRNKIWNKELYSKAQGVFGKTLVLIGVGNIGKEVAKRAAALGMKIYGYDIIKSEDANVEYIDDVDAILPRADVVSIHLPLNEKTKNFFNEKKFSLLKNGCFFINTSRDNVIDETALIKTIKTKGLKVALDVFSHEPEGKDGQVITPLQECENLYITHHIGASTEQAQNAVAEETVKIIETFEKTGSALNCVNKF